MIRIGDWSISDPAGDREWDFPRAVARWAVELFLLDLSQDDPLGGIYSLWRVIELDDEPPFGSRSIRVAEAELGKFWIESD